MAVRAPDRALRDLGTKELKPVSAADELRDLVFLARQVIELQNRNVGEATIEATARGEEVEDELLVSPATGMEALDFIAEYRIGAPRACPAGRPAPVAVDTDDLAFRDFTQQG
jgi:hypothetical protein